MKSTIASSARTKPLGPPWRVLIVDDDEFQHTFLKGLLLELGIFDVEAVESGHLALEKVKSRPGLNLLLLDLMMPGMDGFEFMEAAERLGFVGGLIIISSQSDDVRYGASLVARLRRFHLLGQLPKPADKNAIASMLAHAR